MTYLAYSDGACKGNPGPGGWGSLVKMPDGGEIELHGGELDTTNNKMELMGAIEALRAIPAGATVVLTTDSKYVITGITEWIFGWKRKNWVASTGGAVKNQELWMALDVEVSKRKVKWEWVKGHTGHIENERCDALANLGIAELPGGAAILAAAAAKSPSFKRTQSASGSAASATNNPMNTTPSTPRAPGSPSSMLRRKAPEVTVAPNNTGVNGSDNAKQATLPWETAGQPKQGAAPVGPDGPGRTQENKASSPPWDGEEPELMFVL